MRVRERESSRVREAQSVCGKKEGGKRTQRKEKKMGGGPIYWPNY